MNIWHDIDPKRITPDEFVAVIEIAKGSKNKYELDKETGMLILDRTLYTSTHYPANYGFLPKTLSEDGDALDVLVLCNEVLTPLTLVNCYPIGVVRMIDDEESDDKIIAIPVREPTWNHYKDIKDLPPHILQEIIHFFTVYKQLEGKKTSSLEVLTLNDAYGIIEESLKCYQDKFGNK